MSADLHAAAAGTAGVPARHHILEVRHLSKRFGGLSALDDCSFTVEPGSVLGVIGPNGAGKTTLVNIISGHLRPTGGQVLVDGSDLTGARPWVFARAGVARTFQIVKPFRGLTVRENVAIGALHGAQGDTTVTDASTAVEAVLELVGLARYADALPTQLGVADARRLELAKAMACRPRLVLLDEVMAGLRPTEIDAAAELIHRLRDSGITILTIEHVMRAIVSISDSVLVLHRGQILTRGTPQEVLSDHRVVEAYLGPSYVQRQGA